MTQTYLLDSNVLIALMVDDHANHDLVETWAAQVGAVSVCPITQGALVRSLVRLGTPGADINRLLGELASWAVLRFWPDSVTHQQIDWTLVRGHKQVTDTYLVELARSKRARLATLDRGLALAHPETAELLSS